MCFQGQIQGYWGGREFYKIMHNAHAQTIDHAHFRHLMMDDNDAKAKSNGSFIRNHWNNAKSPDILCIFFFFFFAFSGQKVGH